MFNPTTLSADYRYNALGQRTLKRIFSSSNSTTPTSTISYLYGSDGQLLGQVQYGPTGKKTLAQYWIWLDGLPLAGLELKYASNGTTVSSTRQYYLHSDHLNTPRLATDPSQKLLWSWNSDAFGVGTANADVDGDGIKLDMPLRFPGQQYDAHSGLNYNYFRDYDANVGRYVESDPIGLAGGVNTYAYVSGNPISLFDPFGLREIDLGQGHTGRIDSFEKDGKSSFEIHIYDNKWKEVGVFGPDGWINKHGHKGAPEGLPSEIENRCKGVAVDEMRKRGELPEKGKKNIKGNNWMRKIINQRNPFSLSPEKLPPGHPLEEYM